MIIFYTSAMDLLTLLLNDVCCIVYRLVHNRYIYLLNKEYHNTYKMKVFMGRKVLTHQDGFMFNYRAISGKSNTVYNVKSGNHLIVAIVPNR